MNFTKFLRTPYLYNSCLCNEEEFISKKFMNLVYQLKMNKLIYCLESWLVIPLFQQNHNPTFAHYTLAQDNWFYGCHLLPHVQVGQEWVETIRIFSVNTETAVTEVI